MEGLFIENIEANGVEWTKIKQVNERTRSNRIH